VATAGANEIGPPLLTEPTKLLRVVCGIANEEAIVPFGAVGIVLAFPLLLFVDTPVEIGLEALIVFVKTEADAADTGPVPEDMAGNPELADADTDAAELVAVEAERACVDIVGGVGTREAVEDLAGSSKEGGGKIGFDDAFPVPDGPPPPVRRRGVEPAAPLAALKACCTICC